MGGRRRAVLLTLLALAAPLPAFAISDQALKPVSADPGPAALSVSASLDSCGVMSDQVVCKLDVSFNPLPNADSYSATVTRADGSVTDYGDVGPGGASIWIPYVGAGSYSVKITAYGEPIRPDDPDGHGHVIATDVSRSSPWNQDRDKPHKPKPKKDEAGAAVTEVTGRTDLTVPQNPDADGATTSDPAASAPAPTPDPACAAPAPPPAPPTPPEQPPPDLDPENPDEDADGIPDEQEQATYDQQLAEYQAAVEAQANAPPPAAC